MKITIEDIRKLREESQGDSLYVSNDLSKQVEKLNFCERGGFTYVKVRSSLPKGTLTTTA